MPAASSQATVQRSPYGCRAGGRRVGRPDGPTGRPGTVISMPVMLGAARDRRFSIPDRFWVREQCPLWRILRSLTVWTRSRCCSSSVRRIRIRCAPTAGLPRRSVAQRSLSASSCGLDARESCEGSGAASRLVYASSSRPARSRSWPSSSASSRPTSSALAATSGLARNARWSWRDRLASAPPRSFARRQRPAGCGRCPGLGRRPRPDSLTRSPARSSCDRGTD